MPSDDVSDEALRAMCAEWIFDKKLDMVLSTPELLRLAKRIHDHTEAATARRCKGVCEERYKGWLARLSPFDRDSGNASRALESDACASAIFALFPSSSASPTTEEAGRG